MESQKYMTSTTSPKKRLLVQQPHLIKNKTAGSSPNRFMMRNFNWQTKEGTLSSLDMRRNVPENLNCPGWDYGTAKVTYNPKVMVGNWEEERLRKDYSSTKNLYKENIRTDPSNYNVAQSEALQMRMKNETGVTKDYMFKQHDTLYDQNLITMYDENYNQRWHEKKLPAMRDWNFAHLAWLPEKTDHPLFGRPTQFGLFETMKEKWKEQIASKCHTYKTIYQTTYLSESSDGGCLKKGHNPQQPMKFSYAHHLPRTSIFLKPIC